MKLFSYAVILILCSSLAVSAQVRISKLEIKSGEVYEIVNSDILVADTLIMRDSSKIKLNQLKKENYIRAQVAIIGNDCIIEGRGVNGAAGRNGRDGNVPSGPCQNGETARNGVKGLDGVNGLNLYLYFDELHLKGKFFVDLTGGSGGNGGNGGNGGGGSSGTIHCKGGDGGNGGNGGSGGNGGNGGMLFVNCLKCLDVRAMMSKHLMLRNGGGHFGFGGRKGYAGPPGLAPNKKNGVKGLSGNDGPNGKPGEKGILNFEIN